MSLKEIKSKLIFVFEDIKKQLRKQLPSLPEDLRKSLYQEIWNALTKERGILLSGISFFINTPRRKYIGKIAWRVSPTTGDVIVGAKIIKPELKPKDLEFQKKAPPIDVYPLARREALDLITQFAYKDKLKRPIGLEHRKLIKSLKRHVYNRYYGSVDDETIENAVVKMKIFYSRPDEDLFVFSLDQSYNDDSYIARMYENVIFLTWGQKGNFTCYAYKKRTPVFFLPEDPVWNYLTNNEFSPLDRRSLLRALEEGDWKEYSLKSLLKDFSSV